MGAWLGFAFAVVVLVAAGYLFALLAGFMRAKANMERAD